MHVNLDPLAGDDTDDAAAARCSPTRTPSSSAILRDRSGGNPFFIEELVAMLGEAPATDGARELPATLHGLLAARLDRLDPLDRVDARGRGGHRQRPVRSSSCGRSRATAAPTPTRRSRSLADKDLLELDDDEFRFRNELTRDVAYGTLTKAERARRHGTLSKLDRGGCARRNDRIDEELDRLAYHFNLAASLMAELGAIDGLPSGMIPAGVRFLARAARAGRAPRRLGDRREVPEPRDPAPRSERPRRPAARCASPGPGRAPSCATAPGPATTSHSVLATARASSDDAPTLAAAQTVLGDVQYKEGDLVGSAKTLDDAVARWRELDDPRGSRRRAPLPRA